MIRKVRSLNWFVKNCYLDSSNWYIDIGTNNCFGDTMLKLCGKEVEYNKEIKSIIGSSKIWEEWMFEPL